MAASDNPVFKAPLETDPSLFTTAYKKNRFFIITKRDPEENEEYSPFYSPCLSVS